MSKTTIKTRPCAKHGLLPVLELLWDDCDQTTSVFSHGREDDDCRATGKTLFSALEFWNRVFGAPQPVNCNMKSWTPKSVTELDLDAIKRRARLEALQSLIRKHDQKFGRRNTPLRDLLLNEIVEPYRRRRES
jgi:hypothetical protein